MVIRVFTGIGFHVALAHLPGLAVDDGRMRIGQLWHQGLNAAAKHEIQRLLHRDRISAHCGDGLGPPGPASEATVLPAKQPMNMFSPALAA